MGVIVIVVVSVAFGLIGGQGGDHVFTHEGDYGARRRIQRSDSRPDVPPNGRLCIPRGNVDHNDVDLFIKIDQRIRSA